VSAWTAPQMLPSKRAKIVDFDIAFVRLPDNDRLVRWGASELRPHLG
jgi:hypothetical protein